MAEQTLFAGIAGESGTAAPETAAAADTKTPAPEAKQAAETPQVAQDGKQPEAKGDQAEAKAAPKPIEVKLPEGVEVAAELIEAVKGAAKDGETAQKLVDTLVATQKAAAEKVDAAWEQQKTKWVESIKGDKEIGGANLKTSAVEAEKAARQFGTEAFRSFLLETGFNHHPEVMRFLARVGKAIKEDSIAGTAAVAATTTSPEEILRARYNHPTSKDLR